MGIEKRTISIAVVGVGYVGLSLAALLSRQNKVYAVDIMEEKIDMVNRRQSPIDDRDLREYLSTENLNLTATMDARSACRDADYIIVAVPTNYNSAENSFDTSAVDTVVRQACAANPNAIIVIKSTVPVGYTEKLKKATGNANILFSPEFLRESRSLYDNLYPSRIIVGTDMADGRLVKAAREFAGLMQAAARKENVATLVMSATEAEAVKLFANTYLALRVSFFNELDTYAEINGLDSRTIVEGVCLDPRVGMNYNNPSFGYGGYCLPKDTRQLLANYGSIPQLLMGAVVESNRVRKEYIADRVLRQLQGVDDPVVGVYRLAMKSGSDNFRESAVLDIMEILLARNINLLIYEPTIKTETSFRGCPIDNDFASFSARSHMILANRYDSLLDTVKDKVYTRDLFQCN